MNPDSRFAASLVLSLLIASPALLAVAGGERDIVSGGLRYLAAFVVAWLGVGIVGRLFNDYLADVEVEHADHPHATDAADSGEVPEVPEVLSGRQAGRRRSDQPARSSGDEQAEAALAVALDGDDEVAAVDGAVEDLDDPVG